MQGEVHAVIGPNGAGKTTLVNQLIGESCSRTRDRSSFAGQDITRLPSFRRALLGLSRSYQITSIFPEFTALENVAIAAQAHAGHSFGFWRPANSEASADPPGAQALTRSALPTKAIASRPSWHTANAGSWKSPWRWCRHPSSCCSTSRWPAWGARSRNRWSGCLPALKERYTIVLVEHDMDAVFALADRITVLVYGRQIACGTPQRNSLQRGGSQGLSGRSLCCTLTASRPAYDQHRVLFGTSLMCVVAKWSR